MSKKLSALAVLFVAKMHLFAAPPIPTPEQLAWQKMELTMFCHFGVNTFSDREWGDGKEDPAVFNPSDLDCHQWTDAAKQGGFRLMILTAKHHDGFCLWPSKFTEHSVKNSPWKNGSGDVMRDFVDACRAKQLKIGVYLSPWDRHERSYGTDAYNDYFCNQLTELLTQYGKIDEVWFDGANGEGPNGKKQVYDWERYFALIRKLQATALIAISGPDIRWVGNESGMARLDESSVKTRNGQPVWYPAECDVSIRPGWFYHSGEDRKVKTLEHLIDIYFKSVGRNSVLLLNVPPDRRGRFADADVGRLREFGAAVTAFYTNTVGAGSSRNIVVFSREQTFNLANIQEDIGHGERVKSYRIEARVGETWRTVARGTVIGHRNLHRLPDIKANAVRLVVEQSDGEPLLNWSVHHTMPVGPWAKSNGMSLAVGKPAQAFNVHGNSTEYGGDKAVDGDRNTRWATSDETRACWLEVDLLEEQTIGRIGISELQPRITKFQVECRSNDKDPWIVAYTGSRAGTDFHTDITPVRGRYVRLNVLEATFAPTIWEFELLPPAK